jgi:hypothetical protein
LWLDFPRIDSQPVAEPLPVAEALGCEVLEVRQSKELFVVLESEQAVLTARRTWLRWRVCPGLA